MTDMTTDTEQLDEAAARVRQLLADADRKRQEIAFEPRKFFLAAVSTAAGLIVAGAGLMAGALAILKYLGAP